MCDHHWNWVASRNPFSRFGVHKTANIDEAEKHEHQADRKFHAEPHSNRDRQTENNDGDSHGNDRDGVPRAPTNPNQRSATDVLLTRGDGRNRDDVIRICSMTDPEEKPERKDGGNAEHDRVSRV